MKLLQDVLILSRGLVYLALLLGLVGLLLGLLARLAVLAFQTTYYLWA